MIEKQEHRSDQHHRDEHGRTDQHRHVRPRAVVLGVIRPVLERMLQPHQGLVTFCPRRRPPAMPPCHASRAYRSNRHLVPRPTKIGRTTPFAPLTQPPHDIPRSPRSTFSHQPTTFQAPAYGHPAPTCGSTDFRWPNAGNPRRGRRPLRNTERARDPSGPGEWDDGDGKIRRGKAYAVPRMKRTSVEQHRPVP